MKRIIAIGTTCLLAAAAFAQDVVTAEFELIPGTIYAMDMSPDGRYVVGGSGVNGELFADGAYLWDSVTNTFTDLSAVIDPTLGVPAVAVSDDGQVVLGNIPDPNDPNAIGAAGNVAAIWRASTGQWQSLGYLPDALSCPSRSSAYEISADGSRACGLSWDGCNGRAFRWTDGLGMAELEVLGSGGNRASVMSADGSIVAGFAQGTFGRTPTVWDATGAGQLLDPNNGDALGEIRGINEDGTILLGTWLKDPNVFTTQAHLWTPGTGPGGWDRTKIGAGSILPGWSGNPLDIDDCGTIVGFDSLAGNRRAWIQDDDGTLVEMNTWVTTHGGTIPAGMSLDVCQAISNDGRYIIGHGITTGGWRVTITRTPSCPGDASRDEQVDLTDLALLLAAFGESGCRLPADVNGDGTIDLSDLAIVLANFGNGCT